MASLWKSSGAFQLALTLVFLGFLSKGQGFKQELWLYDSLGNALYFITHIPDTTDYSALLPKVTQACARGRWNTFKAVNYASRNNPPLGPIDMSDEISCYNVTGWSINSLRHYAANDTSIGSISLYPGTDWDGEEILVTSRARTDITHQINTLAATVTSDWRLFQGTELNGTSYCLRAPGDPRSSFTVDHLPTGSGLLTIGSVFKGCDLQEVQAFKANRSVQEALSTS